MREALRKAFPYVAFPFAPVAGTDLFRAKADVPGKSVPGKLSAAMDEVIFPGDGSVYAEQFYPTGDAPFVIQVSDKPFPRTRRPA